MRLPENIGRLVELKTLGLSFNNLLELPESIRYLTALQTLNLWENKVLSFSFSFLFFSPFPFSHPSYQLTHVPPGLCHLSRIRSLPLSQNSLTRFEPENVKGIKECKKKTLSASPPMTNRNFSLSFFFFLHSFLLEFLSKSKKKVQKLAR